MSSVKKLKTQKVKKLKQTNKNSESKGNNVISGQLKKKLFKKQNKTRKECGVIIVRHLPHGFFEEQLRKYFQQFGKVSRVRLARSKRTGRSKGFAFVEFEYPEVAKVAAETMNNYLMFNKVVKASYIPPNEQKFDYFKTSVTKVTNKAGKEIYVSNKIAAINKRVKVQNNWSDEAYQKRTALGLKKLKKIQKKFSHLNLDLSNLVVEPKQVITVEKKEKKDTKPEEVTDTKKKGKETKQATAVAVGKKSKKEIGLADLLESTLDDDSDNDEEYIASESDESENDASDISLSDVEEVSDNLDDSLENESKQNLIKNKKSSKKLGTNANRVEALIKRKPHLGGVQKLPKNKKVTKSSSTAKATKSLKIEAAKELAKPLQTLKKSAKGLASKVKKPKK